MLLLPLTSAAHAGGASEEATGYGRPAAMSFFKVNDWSPPPSPRTEWHTDEPDADPPRESL
jgi:hypothetical protein